MADGGPIWEHERRPWGRGDLVALAAWTVAIAAFFWDAASLRRALFYFDITEINYPYRAFLARELRAGRFSRWCPGLYCGLPLFSESQAGYLHPLKYLLYPWLPTWQAFNLDTILSVWLAGLSAYGWLRRHVGPSGALSGAAVFGLSGFSWAHLVHTSWINALAGLPLVVWSLEAAWERGRAWPLAAGSLAMACQVFAGQLQSAVMTAMVAVLYGLYRAATTRDRADRAFGLGAAAGVVAVGTMLAAVQWVPSKELLDRSPRAGGLSWEELTYGSWHPELLPTLLVREAYGTRARDTDWIDGPYPYHEMDISMGVVGLGLALLGAAAYRDRWVGFWVVLAGLSATMMLGRYTFLFDRMHRVPVLGSARIPVRYHLGMSLAVAALAAVGVDRLSRPGRVRLRGAAAVLVGLAVVSAAILLVVYAPSWRGARRRASPPAVEYARRLADEIGVGLRADGGAGDAGGGDRGGGVADVADLAAEGPGCGAAGAGDRRPAGVALAGRADGRSELLDGPPGERRSAAGRPRARPHLQLRRGVGQRAGARDGRDRRLRRARRAGVEPRAGLGALVVGGRVAGLLAEDGPVHR